MTTGSLLYVCYCPFGDFDSGTVETPLLARDALRVHFQGGAHTAAQLATEMVKRARISRYIHQGEEPTPDI